MTRGKLFQGGVVGLLCLSVGFGAGIAWPEATKPEQDRIEISADVLGLQIFERGSMLGRDLTAEEIDQLTERQKAYEIMVREAASLDIHLKDADIRKHMIAMMQHVMSTRVREPSEEELAEHLEENRDRYMTPRKVTFEHVFFKTDPSEADAWYDVTLSHGAIPVEVGDVFWLGRRMERYSASQLLTVLGDAFVKQLKGLTLNEWSEPIRSARGTHLVWLEEIHEPEALPAEEMQSRLREDWKRKQEFSAFERQISDLSEGYTIIVPDEAAARNAAARYASQTDKIWNAAGSGASE